MRVFAVTNRGLVSTVNQDAISIPTILYSGCDHEEYGIEAGNGLYAVFDGVSGTTEGGLAAHKGAELLSSAPVPTSNEELLALVIDTNARIIEAYNSEAITTASTVAGVACSDSLLIAFNVGDSKVFSINGGFFEEISQSDDLISTVQRMSDDENDEAAASKSPLLQYLGNSKKPIEPHIRVLKNRNPLFICTDGVTDYLDIDDLERLYEASNGDSSAFCSQIKELILAGEAADNFTYLLIEFGVT